MKGVVYLGRDREGGKPNRGGGLMCWTPELGPRWDRSHSGVTLPRNERKGCFPTGSTCVPAKGCHMGYRLPHSSSLLGSARQSVFLEASQVVVAKTPGRTRETRRPAEQGAVGAHLVWAGGCGESRREKTAEQAGGTRGVYGGGCETYSGSWEDPVSNTHIPCAYPRSWLC